ncbi:hypothetical protein [Actinoplanes subglobosus]|uniref:Uncharacterized protein n=1 Tax=Actinoplanes subglobosus TaxID=1547892 RepID=A0ABV8IN09_9ACTN
MRNMVQLLGGVAVAGVVAAGSTAFTAAGVVDSTGANILQGGKVAVTVDEGADLQAITFDTDATNADQITAVHVTLEDAAGAAFVTATGTVKISMTGETGAADTISTCTYSGGGGIWDCTPTSAGFWTGPISAVSVSVWLA